RNAVPIAPTLPWRACSPFSSSMYWDGWRGMSNMSHTFSASTRCICTGPCQCLAVSATNPCTRYPLRGLQFPRQLFGLPHNVAAILAGLLQHLHQRHRTGGQGDGKLLVLFFLFLGFRGFRMMSQRLLEPVERGRQVISADGPLVVAAGPHHLEQRFRNMAEHDEFT